MFQELTGVLGGPYPPQGVREPRQRIYGADSNRGLSILLIVYRCRANVPPTTATSSVNIE